MKKQTILLIFAMITAFSYSRAADDQSVYGLRFGILRKDKEGNRFLSKETAIIPLRFQKTGFEFGIEITAPENHPCIYRIITHTPSPPERITGTFAGVNPEKPSTTVQGQKQRIPGGIFIDPLYFDPGDPVGNWSIEVFIDGKLFKTIKFKVHSE